MPKQVSWKERGGQATRNYNEVVLKKNFRKLVTIEGETEGLSQCRRNERRGVQVCSLLPEEKGDFLREKIPQSGGGTRKRGDG